eukprot:364012_1
MTSSSNEDMWQCPQCTLLNPLQNKKCEVCDADAPIKIKQQYEEKDEFYDEEDQYQESIVTGNDGRREIDVFKPELNDIYACIGQLDIEFNYNLSHKWRGNLTGTGTVIYNKNKTCIVLTAA